MGINSGDMQNFLNHQDCDNKTALHIAADGDLANKALVELLVHSGADVNIA